MTSRNLSVHWAVVGVTALLVVLVVSVPSSTAAHESSAAEGDDPHALDLLNRSATADDRVSYTGTRYVTAWTSLRSSKAAASAVVKVEHQAGGSTALWAHNQQEAVVMDAGAQWLAEASGSVELLAAAYDIRTKGSGYVAGRLADIVEAVRDNGSVAATLWLDRSTALPLRRETFDVDGRMLSASAFVDLRLTSVEPCCAASEASEAVFLSSSDVADLRADGWVCPGLLANGFVLYDARRLGDVVHFAYSDGVMSLSVFQQPGAIDHGDMEASTVLDMHGGQVYVSAGPPTRFMWESGGHVLTAVTDGPIEAVQELVGEAIPDGAPQAESADSGFIDRVVRGGDKVGSWLNPFD